VIALEVVYVLLCLETDVRHGVSCLLKEDTRGGLRGQNQGINTIIDCVRYVDDFRTRWNQLSHHGFQNLSAQEHRHTDRVTLFDNVFLDIHDILHVKRQTEVASGNNYTI